MFSFQVGDRVETVHEITDQYKMPAGLTGTITYIDEYDLIQSQSDSEIYPITVEFDAEFYNGERYATEGNMHPSELTVIQKENDENLDQIDFGSIISSL